MASYKRAIGECDVCGFEYPLRQLKKNSYGMRVCPSDFEGKYDLKNHPQNKISDVKDDETIRDPRPDMGDNYVPVTTTDWLPPVYP